MKKQEKVEVQYIKMNTAITIALVCLVVGILIGILFFNKPGTGSMTSPGRAGS
jgi:hypothetical protein